MMITEKQRAAMDDRRAFLDSANNRAHDLLNDPKADRSEILYRSRHPLSQIAWQVACDVIRKETGRCPHEVMVAEEAWLRGPEMAPVLHVDHLDDEGNPVYEKRK